MKSITEKIDETWDEIIESKSIDFETKNVNFSDVEISDVEKNFVLAKSDGNYCLICYLNENKEFEKKLVRISLSNIESQLVSNKIIRCHRSFLVNTRFNLSKKGNAQGYKLKLQFIDELIPVSRNYLSSILS